jgi:DNA-binding CsgD family transcriptional regulator
MPRARRVLILHPEGFVRDSMRLAIERTDDLSCAGVELDGPLPYADAVLVGFHWLDRRAGIRLRDLRRRFSGATIVVVARAADHHQRVAAADAGVVVLPTVAPLSLVLDALRGEDVMTTDPWGHDAAGPAGRSKLSARELEVLRLVGDGLTSDTVARHLGISNNTCRDHLKKLRAKLDCSTTLQAVVTAARLGMLPGFAPTELRRD